MILKTSDKEKCFTKAYDLYSNIVYRICIHFLKNEEKACDMMQKVFLEFYQVFDEIDPDIHRVYLISKTKRMVDYDLACERENKEVRE